MDTEQRILCLAARTEIAPQAECALLELLGGAVDWERLWQQGHLHEVLPLLATTVGRLGDRVAAPSDWTKRAQRRLYATMVRNGSLADELILVLGAFRQAGIAAIPVKGIVLAETLYGSLGLRSLGDLDVLVRPESLHAARAVLRSLGYAQAEAPDFDSRFHPFHDPPYYRPGRTGEICLELHHGLWPAYFFRPAIAPLWDRSHRAQLHGAEVRLLSPEDTLLHLAIHRSRAALRLRFVCDIAELLRRQGESLDWDYLVAQARAVGARSALFFALLTAHELLEAPVPEGLLPRLKVGRLKQRMLEQTCGAAALFRAAAADDLSQQPSVLLRSLEQDGLLHIIWALGINVVRKSHRRLYKYGVLQR